MEPSHTRHCNHVLHRGTIFSLTVTLFLLLLPQEADSLSPKALLGLIRLKNLRYYSLDEELLEPYPAVSEEQDRRCRENELWFDPLRGSTPAMMAIDMPASWQDMVASLTKENVMREARMSRPVLANMLDVYQSAGLFDNWRTEKTPRADAYVPTFLWRRPWNLDERPGDLQRLLTTYFRILHYYACVLNDEHQGKRDLSEVKYKVKGKSGWPSSGRAMDLFLRRKGSNKIISIKKRVFGIDNHESLSNVEYDLFTMLSHVYLVLPDRREEAVKTLTIEHDVTQAIAKLRKSESIGARAYMRARLCLELYNFFSSLIDGNSWESEAEVRERHELVDLENKLISKLKEENELLKKIESIELSEVR